MQDLSELFATKTRAEWMAAFEGLDVCVGPVNDFAEAFSDEQILAREMIVPGAIPGVGEWKHVGNPIKLGAGAKELVRLPPPRLGEHTADVLGAAGFSAQEVDELRAAGAV
jgi:crotonobetainyl-CoA:carnitine CoA-transferase CaiB-like acyl-CoA transferase